MAPVGSGTGDAAVNSIGYGEGGSCGTVTTGDEDWGEGDILDSPYTYHEY